MNTTLDQFTTLIERFGTIVGSATDWDASSPCEGWAARDVLDHVIDSQRDFLARQELSLGPRPEGSPEEAWAAHASGALERLGDGTVLDREFESYFGPSTIGATIATFYNLDLIIHRWDLARAFGSDTAFTPDEVLHVEACLDELGENLYAHGACSPALPVGSDASPQERILARTGRDPRR
ncbi:TIGR03086 family metal-binding protein [Nocardioides daejeonensis]|uniref:TIGR03086 family metal-binding protein n=1 Tax=Nocardioides daejeonensis TaxID=1046556 RepID=UPI000D741E19|nr:TIGR03086 family metal-binding protein [Nocardioides daejeonensis]